MSSNVVVPNQGYHVFAYEELEADQRILQIEYYCKSKNIPQAKIIKFAYKFFQSHKHYEHLSLQNFFKSATNQSFRN